MFFCCYMVMQNAIGKALIMNMKLKMYFTKRLDYLFKVIFYLNFWKDFIGLGLWPRFKNAAIGPSQFELSIFKKEVLQPRLESTAIGTLKTLRLKKNKKHFKTLRFLSLSLSNLVSHLLSRLPNPHLCNPINQNPHRTRSRLSESVTESTAAMDSEEGTQ